MWDDRRRVSGMRREVNRLVDDIAGSTAHTGAPFALFQI